MTRAKISQYSATANDNTDVNGINIAEGCPPSSMNNMGREIMAALKRFQVGSDGDGVTVGGSLVVSGSTTANTFSATQITASGPVITSAGTASAPAIVPTGDTNTGIFFPAADTIAFAEGGAEAMRIDSSGNVGIGTGTPEGRLQVKSSSQTDLYITAGDSSEANLLFGDATLSTDAGIRYNNNGQFMRFITNNSERARITSGGYFKASNNGTYLNAALYHELRTNSDTNPVVISNTNTTSPYGSYTYFSGATPNNTTNYFEYYEDTTNPKAILYSNGSWQVRANSYGGISDLKLKQDIVDANSQWDDIKGLRIRKYRFKDEVAADPNYPSHLGVIAQEAEIVSPGLVYESPDFENVEVPVLDDEGNPVLNEDGTPQVTTERRETGTVTKAVKYSILYMKAVKALQEAMERIEVLEAQAQTISALEARIAALEN